MTGRIYAYVCTCCGYTVTELLPLDFCPVCREYGCPHGTLAETSDTLVIKARSIDHYITEGKLKLKVPWTVWAD